MGVNYLYVNDIVKGFEGSLEILYLSGLNFVNIYNFYLLIIVLLIVINFFSMV